MREVTELCDGEISLRKKGVDCGGCVLQPAHESICMTGRHQAKTLFASDFACPSCKTVAT